ncbi:NAD-dependent epimerase/dehydratase family protein [Mucilaginibacter sp. RB4R14]|uniref:polysaccharide biosynthesis C-terminal domain-containing protein n=1 Tax=Mucilaginibacter aurantiaciroseus TaxID=2949308 RepID=UPI00209053FB|nr:NAD-dependent epimerase/dehydratase family protein [Mucilaginibacter aurantiaciroseus]MCO5935988.1 NAD-dependent epimerase/dehydratase family protein [Mucilaginibacter aurantiaciroseus]
MIGKKMKNMIKVGITGQQGFVGQHLYNTLGLFPDEFIRVDFNKTYFVDQAILDNFVSGCDVIVHLAAMNRHNDQQVIYENNVGLIKQLIGALERTDSNAHVIFSSSSQENNENLYGKSKKEGRELFINWAKKSKGKFSGLIIPNVFGPFGHPYYNSFVSTFCHQLINNEQPKIEVDGNVKLVYVGDLVKALVNKIRSNSGDDLLTIAHTDEYKVSEVLTLLNTFKEQYLDAGIIPELKDSFEINLFNTFRAYINVESHFPVKFTRHTDPRGTFVEVIRLNLGGQVSFSTTVPGITRGNHYHTRKIERFAVIKGEALIQLRKVNTDKVFDFHLSGNAPAYVDMPIWYTHSIKNTGTEELFTIFWINEFFDQKDPDTYFENV